MSGLAYRTVVVSGEALSTPDAGAWDDLVGRSDEADVAQLTAWAKVRRHAGFTPSYVLVWSDGELAGGAQVLSRSLGPFGRVGYLPRGPIIAQDVDRSQVREALADALDRLTRRYLRALVVSPPPGGADVGTALMQRGFRPSQLSVTSTRSLRLDLEVPAEELLEGLSRRLRTWTRQWANRGVKVRLGGEADVEVLAHLASSTAEIQGFTAYGVDYLRELYRELEPQGHVALFVGEVEGEPVAAELFTICGGVVTARICGLRRTSEATRLNVANAVTWAGIQWSKEQGFRWFDFGGIQRKVQSDAAGTESGHSPVLTEVATSDRSKLKFGGKLYEYPAALEKIAPAALRLSYDASRRVPMVAGLIGAAVRRLRGQRLT